MPALKDEIAQQKAFASPEEEALLNLLRTADCLQRTMQLQIRPWGITATQYNVLRILRGAQPRGLTCSAIGNRMITAEPDITRLLARLKALKLIRQHRDKQDKRVVWTQISPAGLRLLEDSDPAVLQYPRDLLGHLDQDQLATLTQLLELARAKCGSPQPPVTCDGTGDACPTA